MNRVPVVPWSIAPTYVLSVIDFFSATDKIIYDRQPRGNKNFQRPV
jgi:hypothetical protein